MSEAVEPDPGALIGREVAWRRRAAGMSMRELASRASMSQPFLSQVERGISTPSMTSVYRLAQALGIAPGDLLPAPKPEVSVVRAGEGRRLPISESSGTAGIRALLLADALPLTVLEYTITPEEHIEDWYQTAGESGLFVLEGGIVVQIKEGSRFVLEAGDFVHLPAGIYDRWALVGEEPARVLFVISTSSHGPRRSQHSTPAE
ncbi:XRE family transcriptional regulator [Saxibacter everestensis]|uniref:XRE family transcriptional regulator n=1 Tax=Saxibacter everestensis TaxID=2909229 RepID=A0ABY8QRW0_9MICO|nr:XRE family transcriptional regulator [Brevibacteriaceae bacterium ZFBP1038]